MTVLESAQRIYTEATDAMGFAETDREWDRWEALAEGAAAVMDKL